MVVDSAKALNLGIAIKDKAIKKASERKSQTRIVIIMDYYNNLFLSISETILYGQICGTSAITVTCLCIGKTELYRSIAEQSFSDTFSVLT
jgi:hypothetical protein